MYVRRPGPFNMLDFQQPKKVMLFRRNLAAGQKDYRSLSICRHTVMYDSDHERVVGDVGKGCH
jgi:methylmalonyl-CoA mutase N-terminal domain/subunit